MNRRGLVGVGIGVCLVASFAGGCGDSTPLESGLATSVPSSSRASTSTVAIAPVSTTSPETTTPSASVPETTTTAPTTTTPTTTSATTVSTSAPDTTTSVPARPTGWTPSDFSPAAFVLGYSGNWDGPPSPAAPTNPSQPPADGYYVATLRQPWAPGDTSLQVRVQRLEYCSVLPGGCDYYEEGTNETNLDPAWKLDLDVPLDATSRIVLSGFSCWDDSDDQTKQATGADLAELMTSFAADYDQAVLPRLLAGVPNYEVAEAVAATPTGGFVGEVAQCGDGDNGFAGPLRYVHGDAPVLLLQTVTTWDTGDAPLPMTPTDLIGLQGVDYRNGVPTFYFYAGFYS